jgi:cation diffusion facilitator CzcD-associated flavoprotein CzcO/SAM-dependent methyltransferase
MCPPNANTTSTPTHRDRHQVVVIGGGIAGLTVVKICQDHGIDAHAFERTDLVGGVWNHTYKNVRLQQHRDDFTLSGTEWPSGVPDFPDAKAVERYVEKFVTEHNLRSKVSLGVEVVSAVKDTVESKDGTDSKNGHTQTDWIVTLSTGRVVRCEHLIVCTGALGKPKFPAGLVKRFGPSFPAGGLIHSSEYYDSAPFHGKDVLVVGGGSSGIEIAVDLARVSKSTTVCYRSDPDWVWTRHGAFGKSLRLCGAGASAPLWLRNLFARVSFKLKVGSLSKHGLKPSNPPLNRRIVVSDEFYPLVAHGAIRVKCEGVRSVDGARVDFADGSSGSFDTVVLCTGYDVSLSAGAHPYLREQMEKSGYLKNSVDGAPNVTQPETRLEFYLGCFLPNLPDAYFVGGCFGFAAVPRIAELQAKTIVNVLLGVKTLPDSGAQTREIREILKHKIQGGNTNVYTANSYYRKLLEASGEMRSARSVDLSVRLKGVSAISAVLSSVSLLASKISNKWKGKKELKELPKALALAAGVLGLAGSALNKFGRLKGASPNAVSRMPALSNTVPKPVRANAAETQPRLTAMHTSDSVLSMCSIGGESSGSSSAGAPEKSPSPASPIKMAEDTTLEGQKIASSRFKTPKEQVQGAYDTWADAYEHDSLEKLGFASPKACVDTFLSFCPPHGKDVLDVGAGTGVLANMICARGHKAAKFDAMDLSPGMLKHLVKKGIYNKVEAHDMSKYPWPFASNKYDGLMCNGVLIYVDDPECLDEFVRVTKPGGVCVIMWRHDGYPDYRAKDLQLRAQGKWELVHVTPDQRNFDNMEFGENEEDVIFNQWVFRVRETSADVEV